MRFTDLWEKVEDILLVEKYYQYTFPKNPETQMYDFYVLDYLNTILDWESKSFRDLPTDLVDSVKTAYTSLLPQLRTSLLDDVYYALCAEIRHAEDFKAANRALLDNNPKLKALYKTYLQYMVYNNYINPETADIFDITKPSSEVRVPEIEKDNTSSTVKERNKSFKASHYAIKKTGSTLEDFVQMCDLLFSNGQWSSGYGGKNWGKIAKGWLLLKASDEIIPTGKEHQKAAKPSAEEVFNKSLKQYQKDMARRKAKKGNITEAVDMSKGISKVAMSVAIDHVYDLQHNNDTVFNKLISYKKSNAGNAYEWIENTLDFRANLSSYFEMLSNASDAVKYMAPPVLYNKIGQTWEKDLKTITPAELDLDEYEQVEIKRPEELKKNDYVVLKGAGGSRAPFNTTVGSTYRVVMDYKGTNKLGRAQNKLLIIGDDGSPAGVKWDYFKLLRKKLPEDLQPKPVQSTQSIEGKIYTIDEINDMEQVPSNDVVKNSGLAIGDWVVCRYKMGTSTTIGKAYQIEKFNTGQNQIAIKGDDGNEVYIASYRFSIPPDAQVLTNVPSSKSQPTTPKSSSTNKIYTPSELAGMETATGDNVKAGDELVFNHSDFNMTQGKVYKVLKVNDDADTFEVTDDDGNKVGKYWSKWKLLPFKKSRETSSEATNKYDFKVGDVVEATENIDTYNLTPGKLYTLLGMYDRDAISPRYLLKGEYLVELMDDKNHKVSMFAYRFKKPELMTPKTPRVKTLYDFKEGDMVEAVNPGGYSFTVGKLYKVEQNKYSPPDTPHEYNIGQYIILVNDDKGVLKEVFANRFKKPEQNTSKTPRSKKPYDFKVGDMVVFKETFQGMTQGKAYKAKTVLSPYTRHGIHTLRVDNDDGSEVGFYAYRFEPYPVKRPSQVDAIKKSSKGSPTQAPFKVGDKVKCIDSSGVEYDLTKGEIYNVVDVTKSPLTGKYHISVKEAIGGFKAERFEKVEDTPETPTKNDKEIKVGDTVECIANHDYTDELTIGKQYTVDKMSAVSTYVINDLGNQFGYYTNRFKKVEPSKTPTPTGSNEEVKVGDTVECVSDKSSTGTAIPGITVGKQYKVIKMIGTLGKGINIINDDGVNHSYFMDRFKKVKSPAVSTASEEDVKIGDTVECVTDQNGVGGKLPGLTVGKQYKVTGKIHAKAITIINDDNNTHNYFLNKFKKVSSTTTHPFKKGDKVKCIDNETASGHKLLMTVGKVYEVVQYEHYDSGGSKIYIINDSGNISWYKSSRFEKVEDETPTKPDTPKTRPPKSSVNKEEEIKVGDYVECVNNSLMTSELTIGKPYEVVYVSLDQYQIKKNDAGIAAYYNKSRFKKLTKL